MAQIFHPSFNTLSRASVLGGILASGLAILIGTQISRSSYNTKANVALEQPVPFSHEHHAVELGIDCRYCHTSVEKAANAGMPATQTCMSCHSQIWTNSNLLEPVRASWKNNVPIKWNKVNNLPDFVYFNHSIHVNRGLSCNNCHGPIQKMMMTYKANAFFMSWCLNCHRNPERYVRPRSEVWSLYTKYQQGQDKLSPEEVALANGYDYKRTPERLEEGEALLKKYHVQKKELTDCWICHR